MRRERQQTPDERTLSAAERAEIDRELAALPRREAGTIAALQAVQRHRGWVSDAAVAAVADHLGLSPATVEGVATFYNLIYRRPVGRHVVHLCDSVSCWMLGAGQVRRRLEERLGIDGFGATSADGRFTLLPIQCLGTCDRAPAMMVDEDLHRDLAPDGLETILEGYE